MGTRRDGGTVGSPAAPPPARRPERGHGDGHAARDTFGLAVKYYEEAYDSAERRHYAIKQDAKTNIILVRLTQGRLRAANKWRNKGFDPFNRNPTPAIYTPRGMAYAMRHLAKKDRTKKALRIPEYAIIPVGIATAATLVWSESRLCVDDDLHTLPDTIIDASESSEGDRRSTSSGYSSHSFADTDDYYHDHYDNDHLDYYYDP